MKKEIFIVHNSDIFRKGLNVIVRNYFNLEITQLHSLNELTAFTHIKNAYILVFAEIANEKELNLIYRLKTSNNVHIVKINSDNETLSQLSGIDQSISINSTNEDIRAKVSQFINSVGNNTDEKVENGELTSREKDVLELVAFGHSNKDIAEKLFISIHTVISHRKNITEKLGIKSISGLTVYAILNKVIDPDKINPDNLI